ncbi:MAG: cytochrome c [Thiohalomonadales bacterium]
MRRKILLVSAIGLASAVLATGVMASAQYPHGDGNVANGQAIFENGKGDVPACVTCHGADGSGDDALGTPRLSGQYFTFLLKQLEDFATDKRMDTTMFIMNINAKGLTPQDRRDVATFLAAKKVEFKTTSRTELEAAGHKVGATNFGKSLVELGSAEVSACKSCHGYAGRGAPPVYPMIGQQRYVYLVNQLKKWKDGSRANDPMGQMRAIAKKLSDEDILNAAAYLTSASPLSLGNDRTPYDMH